VYKASTVLENLTKDPSKTRAGKQKTSKNKYPNDIKEAEAEKGQSI
jgi:hypothetical protein